MCLLIQVLTDASGLLRHMYDCTLLCLLMQVLTDASRVLMCMHDCHPSAYWYKGVTDVHEYNCYKRFDKAKDLQECWLCLLSKQYPTIARPL